MRSGRPRDFISFGVALLLGFDALLRPGELAVLTPRKLALPNARLHGLVAGGLATITNGTSRQVFGRIQIESIRDARCLRWLSWLLAGMDLDMRLLPGGAEQLRGICFSDSDRSWNPGLRTHTGVATRWRRYSFLLDWSV